MIEAGSPASKTEDEWRKAGKTAEADQIRKIATAPVPKWFGNWSYGHGGTQQDVEFTFAEAESKKEVPEVVLYGIPLIDCGTGGFPSESAYKSFVAAVTSAIRGRKAVVVVEPDALAGLQCHTAEQQAMYYRLIKEASEKLSTGETLVYLDSGNEGWTAAATMAERLVKAGVAFARGFTVNVSNFYPTTGEEVFGDAIITSLGLPKHYVVDTSRNGKGNNGSEWCNPPGRGLGARPTGKTGQESTVDGYLWVKRAGESDGTCNGGPAAGQWWPAYALGLAERSVP